MPCEAWTLCQCHPFLQAAVTSPSGEICLPYAVAASIGGMAVAAGVALWRRNVALQEYMRQDSARKDAQIERLLQELLPTRGRGNAGD